MVPEGYWVGLKTSQDRVGVRLCSWVKGGSTDNLRGEEGLSRVGEWSEASNAASCLGFSGGVGDPLFTSVFSCRQFAPEVIKPPPWTLILF